MAIQYHNCFCAVGWYQPDCLAYVKVDSRHRTLKAAVRADNRLQRKCRVNNGSGSYYPTRILGYEDGYHRELTESESEQLDELRIDESLI